MTKRIIKLPDSVANQIAAGEVVERPVAVVKELVENAIDAEAKSIEIQFERGGKSLIRVMDDGIGMSPEDAVMALERHATSKIQTVEDILRIQSFGFRGEALPSIASVSRFSLKTRRRDAPEGTEITISGPGKLKQAECGMSPGTDITVAQLFHGVPARRKFMKTDRTESAHIIQMCRLLAVAHPDIAFSLVEDGHEVFRTPSCPDRMQRVKEIFGRRRTEDLVSIEVENSGIRLSGLVGRPGAGRNTRSELITYVNQRPVESRLLNYALIESYHRYLPRGRYPISFLFLQVPPEQVDVNVHPTKREVRFRNEPAIRQAVMSALTELLEGQSRQALRQASPVTPAPENQGAVEKPRPPQPRISPAPRDRETFSQPAEKPFREAASKPDSPVLPEQAIWRYCGTFRKRIGLFESPDGLVLLSARSARERILLERVQRSLQGEALPRQPLLIPRMIELAPLEASIAEDQLEFFNSLGFELEAFGRHMFRVRSVPAWMEGDHAESFLEDLLRRIRERGLRPDDREASCHLIARLAAARESRNFTPADEGEWKSLARGLLACENPLLDARGRPTFVEIRNAELTRKLMLEGSPGELEGLDGT